MTQEGLARQVQTRTGAKISQSTIGNLEASSRARDGAPRYLVEIARALRCSVDWLYDGKGEPPSTTESLQVAEPQALYTARWPFQDVTPHQYFEVLTDTQRSRVEGFVLGLLSDNNGRPKKTAYTG